MKKVFSDDELSMSMLSGKDPRQKSSETDSIQASRKNKVFQHIKRKWIYEPNLNLYVILQNRFEISGIISRKNVFINFSGLFCG